VTCLESSSAPTDFRVAVTQKRPVRVYLSGPITGGSDRSIETWRHLITRRLAKTVQVVDPASYYYEAGVAYLKAETPLQAAKRLRHGAHVVQRSQSLIEGCDLVLANLLESPERASIGAVGEIFLAHALDKPVIIVRQQHGNVHDHAMLNAIAERICHSLDDAATAIGELALRRKPTPRTRAVRSA
jgi:nucleoside 2-deoxyribosyltransferase